MKMYLVCFDVGLLNTRYYADGMILTLFVVKATV